MIELAFPWALLALPLPWLIWRFAPPSRERITALRIPFFRQITEAAGKEPQAGAVILQRQAFQVIVAALVWLLLILSLARPERVGEPIVNEKAARDVMLALDISGSMDERDFEADDGSRLQRLDAVKYVLSDFIAARDGDRIGLIIFGAKAFVQAPFTEDLKSVQSLLDQTQVGMAGPHTVLGDAIGLAIRTFEASEIRDRLLILLSDGADTGSRMSPVNAAEIAASRDVIIYSIGVGDPNGEGEDRVDLAALEDIANRASGEFFFAADETALSEIYQRIDELEPRKVDVQSYRPREALAHIPLAIAALLATISTSWLFARSSTRAQV